MRRRRLIPAAGLLLLCLGGSTWGQESEDPVAERTPIAPREVVYKTVGDVELKLYVFEPEDDNGGTPRAAVVFFFGGGWVGGSPGQFYPHCRYFATRGMVACAAEYRIRTKHGTTPFECVADGKSAVRWLRAHAEQLGIDPQKIVAGGGSAGGHVAACTGTIEGMDEEGEDLQISFCPNAMMLFNPVIDTSPAGYGHDRVKGRMLEISPAHHVRKGIPPTIIFHGTADKTVPFENVERFTRLMKAAGNTCELVSFEGKGHGFFNYGRDKESYPATVRAADRFLKSLGYLEGEPTL